MTKLLRASFARLKQDKVFWLAMATMFAWAAVWVVGDYFQAPKEFLSSLEQVFFEYGPLIGIFAAIVAGLFIGTDYSDGTIRNKILVGHSRTSIYFANLTITAVANLMMVSAWLMATLVFGVPLLGTFTVDLVTIASYLFVTVFMVTALAAIYNMFSMLISNKAYIVVATILVFIIMTASASYCLSRLDEPELQSGGLRIVTGGDEIKTERVEPGPNPNYVTGKARKLLEFVVAFLPTGQGIRISHLSLANYHYWQMPLYSLLIVLATSFGGIMFFKRKNLN